ncbi:MAG: sensor histidine kinase [Bacteroidales bacterium]|nr:sensor histidine kinase [Lachnoclostridium sp.]MCM1384411.1 sensor histidine kinase [Lachnoclostridium sp.]MCM1465191.1 sensor histidine kinase [Bacteroidales bacterium]
MKYVKAYWRKRAGTILLVICLLLFFHLYYGLLVSDISVKYEVYFDLLLAVALLFLLGIDFMRLKKWEREKEEALSLEDVIFMELSSFENRDIALHDVEVLKKRLAERGQENRDLQDYVAKWCHEIKIPLAAAFLMDEEIPDARQRGELRGQLERISRQVNSMLLGCRLSGEWLDLQIKAVSLSDCVKTAVKNNSFFLIQKKFTLDIRVGDEKVHTDPSWLVYILDQLFSNAIKYALEDPRLIIRSESAGDAVILSVEDRGEGIAVEDIRRVFEKGFTGSSHHNGKYKSTGMGLYMVSKIIEKLEHEIHIESEQGKYTRVSISFIEPTLQKL